MGRVAKQPAQNTSEDEKEMDQWQVNVADLSTPNPKTT